MMRLATLAIEGLSPLVSLLKEVLFENPKEKAMKFPLFPWLSIDDEAIYSGLRADLEKMDGGREALASLDNWLKESGKSREYNFKRLVCSHDDRQKRMNILVSYARKTNEERDRCFAIDMANAPFVEDLKEFFGDRWDEVKDLIAKEEINGKVKRKIVHLIDERAEKWADELEGKYGEIDELESGLSKIIRSRLALRKMSWSEAWNSSQLTFWKKIFITIL